MRRARRPGVGFWSVWLSLAALAVALSVAATLRSHLPGDVALAKRIQALDQPGIGGILHALNVAGTGLPAFASILLLAGILWLLGHPWPAVALVGVNALRPIGSLLKLITDRPRPSPLLIRVMEHPSDASFPSGHVFGAVLLYGLFAVLLERTTLQRALRRALQAACFVVMALMGVARVYVGAHWPSDVLGGYLWGALIVVLVARTLPRTVNRRRAAGGGQVRRRSESPSRPRSTPPNRSAGAR
jgi:undecaprenyl-diphosphatase